MSTISDRLKRVKERVVLAAEKSSRSPDEITVIAVSKTRSVEEIEAVIQEGVTCLGENRVQEAEDKVSKVSDKVCWHLVGHLQRNKSRDAVSIFEMIHSVDSLRLATELGKRADQIGRRANILIQVNTSGAESQYGVEVDEAQDLVGAISKTEGVRIQGLMTIGAFLPEPEQVRPSFVRLRELRDKIAAANISGVYMKELSMGMTGDFEVAIEEGATLVRIGTAIFGPRL
jgi:hypothetical protein